MAPGRITRSANNPAPRKRYDIDPDSVYEPETAAPAKVSSDDDTTDDTIPAAVTPRSKAKTALKRKQPATPASRKGKDSAKPSPNKKPRKGMREPTPRINYASVFGGFGQTPEVELPKVPQSTYAASEMGEWSHWSDRMVDILGEQMNDSVDDEVHEPNSPICNQGALAVLQQTLREKEAEGSFRAQELGQSRSGASREGSIVWMDTSVMGPRDSARPPSACSQAQSRVDEQLQPEAQVQLRNGISDQQVAEAGYEAYLAEGDPRGVSLTFERWMRADDQQSQVDPEQREGQPGAGDSDHSPVSEENDFDVNFDDDHEPPQDVYDVGDTGDLSEAKPGVEGRLPDEENVSQSDDLPSSEDMLQHGDLAHGEEAYEGTQRPQDSGVDQPHEEAYEADQPIKVGNGRAEEHDVAGVNSEEEAEQRPVQRPAGPQLLLFVEPAQDTVRAVIKSRPLHLILGRLNTEAWTAEGRGWEARMLAGSRTHLSSSDKQEISKERRNARLPPLPSGQPTPAIMWYAYHRDEVNTGKAREMLQTIYRVWHICREAPKARDLEAQADYFTRGVGKGFRKCLKSCQIYVKYICDRLPAGEESRVAWAKSMRKSLCRRLIPLMALLLKEVFMLASTQPQPKNLDLVQELPEQVKATNFHLHALLAVTTWLKQLSQAMLADFEQNVPSSLPNDWGIRTNQRFSILRPLKLFDGVIQQAIKDRDEEIDEPSRKVRAAEKDRQERAHKEAALRSRRKAQQRQYQLWQASMSTPSLQKRNRQAAPPASTFVLSQSTPKRKKISPKEEYAVKNGGWYWDEDDTLMNALRRVDRPSASGLADALPGRDEDQVRRRLMELREIGRKHYEEKGLEVPKWCRGYVWR